MSEQKREDEQRSAKALGELMASAPDLQVHAQALADALNGILEDDSRFVSLKDQRTRWDSRMEAARAALAAARKAGVVK